MKCVQNVNLLAEQSGKWKPSLSSPGPHQITLSQEPCSNQTSSISGEAKMQLIHQAQQSEGTRQLLHTSKTPQNQDNMPVQTTTPSSKHKKQEFNVEIIPDIPEATQPRHSPSKVNDQIYPESGRDRDNTSEKAKLTLALISDPRVCDASRLSQDERMCVMEEAVKARALVATMVFQDGTTQLDPEQVG